MTEPAKINASHATLDKDELHKRIDDYFAALTVERAIAKVMHESLDLSPRELYWEIMKLTSMACKARFKSEDALNALVTLTHPAFGINEEKSCTE